MNDTNATTQHTVFVLRRLTEPFPFFGLEDSPFLPVAWLILLGVVLVLGLTYVIWMYVRDARSVGWVWASFLGLLRCTVYAVLAGVFLLPGCQSVEETRTQSRVGLLFDTSASVTNTRDDVPTPTTPYEKLPTRQDKVLKFLADDQARFIERLMEKNPVFAYRFGRALDEEFVVFHDGRAMKRADWEALQRPAETQEGTAPEEPKSWGPAELQAWLKPDTQGEPPDHPDPAERERLRKRQELYARLFAATNVGDSALAALNRESNNLVQGVVVVSDGRSTEGSVQSFRNLADLAQKKKIPVFVVAVGEVRQRVRIDITDLRVPEQARPDDKFKVAVEVNGEGLAGQRCEVELDVIRPNGDKAGTLRPPLPVPYKPGEPPHASAEFEIDPGQFNPAGDDAKKKPELEEGDWKFIARVRRDPREIFPKPEHVTEPAVVQVVKKPIRVLVFASGPTHEYQFVTTLLQREVDKKRADMCIYLQPAPGQEMPRQGRVQNVPPDKLLTQFPLRFQDESADKPDERNYNLAAYDVILAFDPDWTRLTPEQIHLLERWVTSHGGGLVVVAGPVNTLQLARPGAAREKLAPLLGLYPVVLQDARLQELERPTAEPWRLHFPGANPEMEFLNLEEEDPTKGDMLTGWRRFFDGDDASSPLPQNPKRGFFNYYPVEKAKDGATVVATVTDPRARLTDGKEQPFLVTWRPGAGRVVWLGWGDFRRLRMYRSAYHERFWTKLARYAGSGSVGKFNRRVNLVMGRSFTANNFVQVEAQVFGRDMNPLPEGSKPQVHVKPPTGSNEKEIVQEMSPRPGQVDWNGWFTGRFLVRSPGEYNLEIKVPETGDSVTGKFQVREANPELDNTRPDFDQLYWMASDAALVLERVNEPIKRELQQRLTRPRLTKVDRAAGDAEKGQSGYRLFFTLDNADLIPACMITDRQTHTSRGAIHDLWDKGPFMSRDVLVTVLWVVNVILVVATLVIGALTVLFWVRGTPSGIGLYLLLSVVLLLALVPLQVFFVWYFPEQAVLLSVTLVVVVGLLGLEWLTRKMLRLA